MVPGGVTVNPAGNTMLPVVMRADATSVLPSMAVSVVVAPAGMLAGANATISVGAGGDTVSGKTVNFGALGVSPG